MTSGQQVWVTRPAPESEILCAKLHLYGIQTHSEPLIKVSPVAYRFISKAYQTLVFTSRNALRYFDHSLVSRSVPVYVPGHSTASAAKSKGYENVVVCTGAGAEMIDVIPRRLTARNGEILYVSGDVIRHDLQKALRSLGFAVERLVCYKSVLVCELSPEITSLIKSRKISAIPFFSPRAAENFIDLMRHYNLEENLGSMHAVCLSENIALPLRQIPWQSITVTKYKTAQSMADVLRSVIGMPS